MTCFDYPKAVFAIGTKFLDLIPKETFGTQNSDLSKYISKLTEKPVSRCVDRTTVVKHLQEMISNLQLAIGINSSINIANTSVYVNNYQNGNRSSMERQIQNDVIAQSSDPAEIPDAPPMQEQLRQVVQAPNQLQMQMAMRNNVNSVNSNGTNSMSSMTSGMTITSTLDSSVDSRFTNSQRATSFDVSQGSESRSRIAVGAGTAITIGGAGDMIIGYANRSNNNKNKNNNNNGSNNNNENSNNSQQQQPLQQLQKQLVQQQPSQAEQLVPKQGSNQENGNKKNENQGDFGLFDTRLVALGLGAQEHNSFNNVNMNGSGSNNVSLYHGLSGNEKGEEKRRDSIDNTINDSSDNDCEDNESISRSSTSSNDDCNKEIYAKRFNFNENCKSVINYEKDMLWGNKKRLPSIINALKNVCNFLICG